MLRLFKGRQNVGNYFYKVQGLGIHSIDVD